MRGKSEVLLCVGALRSTGPKLPVRVLPRISTSRGPIYLLLETRANSSPGAGLAVLRGAVHGAEARTTGAQSATHPTGAWLPGAPGWDRCVVTLETAAAHRATASSTAGSKSSSMAHFFAITKWLVHIFLPRGFHRAHPELANSICLFLQRSLC